MRAHLEAASLVEVTGSNLNLVYLVLAIALVALGIAFALRAQVLSASDGTPKMKEIAAAVQEGAAADRKSTRLNSSHIPLSRMPSSA